ncbi:MAG: D-inositol-3-phosphate glycosyltransferase [Ignavibacteria bacterium]|nr:D-inositol-3-phosphate glycosyltransferase [Ignavibacteria bacterium]
MKSEKKKIIMIGSLPPPYHGSNMYFHSLINSRIKNEFSVSHLDISDHRDINNLSKLDYTNVKTALTSIFNLKKLLKKIEPDIVYIPVSSNFLPYLRDGLFILISSYFSNAKILIHLHEGSYFRNVFYNNSQGIVKKFIRYTLSKVDTAIVYSENLKRVFEGFVKNVTSFPNGMDFEISSDTSVKNENEFRYPVITFMGNLFETKGILDVIKAAVKVIAKYKDASFQIAGMWTDNERQTKSKALELIDKHKIRNNIVFNGVVTGNEKDKLFRETDIFIFPTFYPYEGCPLVIIEAMAYGIPVISTKDIGAISEMVIHGETGFLTEKKAPEQAADFIIRLADDKEQRMRMGTAAKRKYENEFTLEKNLQNIINTFYKVLN